MLVKLKCSECGEHTYPEATIDADDLLFTIPPCEKCLKTQAEEMIEEIDEYRRDLRNHGEARRGTAIAISIITKKAGL